MRLKQTIFLSFLTIAGLTSCEKNLYDPSQNKEETSIEDLVISDDFDWKMSKNAECTLSSDRPVMVSIYLDEVCSQDKLLATIPVLPGKSPKLPLSVLTNTTEVYLQYENETGSTSVTPASVDADGNINFSIKTNQTRAGKDSRTDDTNFEERGGIIYYPSAGGGTVMFEDNFPTLGDYDFNDFVASYIIEIQLYPDGSNDIKSINFYMTVRGIGASKHFIPHLRLTSFTTTSLDGDPIVTNDGFDNLNVKLLSDYKDGQKEGKIVLAFYGAEDKAGNIFLNTEKGSTPILPRKFDVTLNFQKGCSIDYLYLDKFDIFLATANQTEEIHMLNYGPAFKSDGYDNPNYYKDPATNLVWGINIPDIVDHTYEGQSFLKAYPKFEDWVTGKTGIGNSWYKEGNSEYLFPISFK